MLENFWPGSQLNYAALAIPAFFLFVGIEHVAASKLKKSVFQFDSSVANLTIGVAERLLNLFLTASFYGAFWYLYDFALFNIPNHWAVWMLLLLATDLVWYWYHRLGHEVNILWAAHIVHHQSEEFNYTVSARITTLQAIIRNVFWCLLPLVGFHPTMVMATLIIHGAYSFFTHTQMIGKLGWLEYVFITPSHHRVHHASNEKYLNKNYGDLFIFWDLLFGTFQREEEKPVYGLTHPLKSYSFIWQHAHYFLELLFAARRATGLKNKLAVFLGSPESLDQHIRPRLERLYLPHKSAPKPSERYRNYVALQIVAAVVALFLMALFITYLNALSIFVTTSLILLTLINCGALLEQRVWIYPLELLRLMMGVVYLAYVMDQPLLWVGYLILLTGILLRYKATQKKFLVFIYG